jgi:hypothetical protein
MKVINMEMDNIERAGELTNTLELHEVMWKWVNDLLIEPQGTWAGGDQPSVGR